MEREYGKSNLGEAELKKQVEQFIEKERWGDARNLLNQSYQVTFNSIGCLEKLGYCSSKLEDYPKAIEIFEELCNREPSKARWYYYLAFQKKLSGDREGAIQAYEKCMDLSPLWIKPYLELGKIYEESKLHDSMKNALRVYREGINIYRDNDLSKQKSVSLIYSQVCTKAAQILASKQHLGEQDKNEIEYLLKEATIQQPLNADTWYRVGSFYLDISKYDDALEILYKAKTLDSRKIYIPHKIACVFIEKDDIDSALKIYKSIPEYKRTFYILRGLAKCLDKKGCTMEAAQCLYQSIKREPNKFFLHRDFGEILIKLGDREQAAQELEIANKLFKSEQGEDNKQIISRIEEIRELPQGETVNFEEPKSTIVEISHGSIIDYKTDRGFGFIIDDSDNKKVFFHITKFKKGTQPSVGDRVRFIRETGEKGPQASKVWIDYNNR